MAYEFTSQVNSAPYKTTGELALEAELTAFDSDLFDAAMVRFGYGSQPDLSDETMTDARAVYGVGGSVTDETFTSAYDTWVDLANEKIGEYNFTVETTDGTIQYSEGTDFELDYENGKIKVLSTGSMADTTDYHITYNYNKGQKLITGLTSATQYYYKGYFLPVMFDSASLMDVVVQDDSFMTDIINNEQKSSDIVNYYEAMMSCGSSSTVMDKILNNNNFMTSLLNSSAGITGAFQQVAVDKIYSSSYLSSYWTGTITNFGTDYINIFADDASKTATIVKDVDLSYYDSLKIDWKNTGEDVSGNRSKLIVDGTTEIYVEGGFSKVTDTLDVSNMNDLVTIEVEAESNYSGWYSDLFVYGIWGE